VSCLFGQWHEMGIWDSFRQFFRGDVRCRELSWAVRGFFRSGVVITLGLVLVLSWYGGCVVCAVSSQPVLWCILLFWRLGFTPFYRGICYFYWVISCDTGFYSCRLHSLMFFMGGGVVFVVLFTRKATLLASV
jgi:hypothetical protein